MPSIFMSELQVDVLLDDLDSVMSVSPLDKCVGNVQWQCNPHVDSITGPLVFVFHLIQTRTFIPSVRLLHIRFGWTSRHIS